jgi:hypothetical protein
MLSAPTRRRFLERTVGTAESSCARCELRARVFAPLRSWDPVRVFNTFTKAVALFGEATFRGIELYLDGTGRNSLDEMSKSSRRRRVQSPGRIAETRKLVESDKVHAVLGSLGSRHRGCHGRLYEGSGTPDRHGVSPPCSRRAIRRCIAPG